ncbi:S8 family peptidase [Deinococcus sonorensis]|uniref:S8 family serine peptidase n=2 Tax=Deinococcus sonorensis TaxID=309891 RepID=A0AAU7UA02_9DEIO
MSLSLSNRLAAGLSLLLLTGCGSVAPTQLHPLALPSGQYSTAEATGKIGAWASGKIGAWASGSTASTLPSGVPNTFTDNLAAWNMVQLSAAQVAAPHLGAGIKVAVIDTGLDLSHPAFQGHLAPAADQYDFLDNDTSPAERGSPADLAYGHGTAIASLVLQVAPKATIMPLRVIAPNGLATPSVVASAVNWAVQHGATVINLSVVSSVDSALTDALRAAAAKGVYLVMAAGNEGVAPPMYPARSSAQATTLGQYALSVGSLELSTTKSDFSNYGTQLSLLAPGRLMTTAYPGSQFAQATGTSFAAPVVSGVLALALGEPLSTTNRTQLVSRIVGSARDVSAANAAYKVGSMPFNLISAANFLNTLR